MNMVLVRSLEFVVIGPFLPLFWHAKYLSILLSIGFWCALLGTACGSRRDRVRRWFYVLFGVYIVLTFFGMVGEIAMGIIAMAHALG